MACKLTDYSFWSIMQEKVYQTHIANIDELKHRLVQVWAELEPGPQTLSLQLSNSGDGVSMRVARVVRESSVGIF